MAISQNLQLLIKNFERNPARYAKQERLKEISRYLTAGSGQSAIHGPDFDQVFKRILIPESEVKNYAAKNGCTALEAGWALYQEREELINRCSSHADKLWYEQLPAKMLEMFFQHELEVTARTLADMGYQDKSKI
jgi:hypothetical protein